MFFNISEDFFACGMSAPVKHCLDGKVVFSFTLFSHVCCVHAQTLYK
jgi:hypothetical protein